MKKTLIVLIALAVVAPVFAQDSPEGPPPIAIAAHNHVIAFLDLSEVQVAAWDEINLIHRDAEEPIKEEIRILEGEIKALIEAGDPDATVVGELVLEIAELKSDLHEIHTIYHEGFVALLDEDQAQRLGFIARADRAQKFIPAFRLFELIPRR